MFTENELKPFDEQNMPLLVDRVLHLWKVDGKDEKFNRLYVEMIIRTNLHENQMQLELRGNDEKCPIKAICFGAKKGDPRNDEWYENLLKSLSASDREIFENGRRYLLGMDEKTFSLMSEDDVKLCLFISLEKGSGTEILSFAEAEFKMRGFKNLYLWTDCECNVDWYFKNGFELVLEEEFKPFSLPEKPYVTYIFRKAI